MEPVSRNGPRARCPACAAQAVVATFNTLCVSQSLALRLALLTWRADPGRSFGRSIPDHRDSEVHVSS